MKQPHGMRRYIQPRVIIGSHKTFQKLRECDAVIEAAIQMASTNEGLCRVSSTFGHLCGGRGNYLAQLTPFNQTKV